MRFCTAGRGASSKRRRRGVTPSPASIVRKKNLYWFTRLGRIEIEEQVFTRGRRGPEIRPFSESAEVQCRECSKALQRAIVDWGADDPFAGASVKLKEHYGIDVPVSTIRALTENTGKPCGRSRNRGARGA